MSGLKLRGLTFPEKLEPKTSEKAQLQGENKAAPLGTGYWGSVDIEADGLVRAERTGDSLDLWCFVYGCGHTHAWQRPVSHTHPSHMLCAHSHMHMHSLGGQGQSLTLLDRLCKVGLGKSAHGDPGQKMRCVHKGEGKSKAHQTAKPSLWHVCNMKVSFYALSPDPGLG